MIRFLYNLPEAHVGETDLLLLGPENEREFAKLHVIESPKQNDYLDYFRYAIEIRILQKPCD